MGYILYCFQLSLGGGRVDFVPNRNVDWFVVASLGLDSFVTWFDFQGMQAERVLRCHSGCTCARKLPDWRTHPFRLLKSNMEEVLCSAQGKGRALSM